VEINAAIVAYPVALKVEDGKRIRIDSTTVESNIHHPTDSAQLWDCVRVLTRILRGVETEFEGLRGRFSDHTRVAKKLRYKINNTRGEDNKRPLYKRLIDTTEKTVAYAEQAMAKLEPSHFKSLDELLVADALRSALEEFTPLTKRVIEQSTRRTLNGNTLSALVQSRRVYKQLRKWRAGIEGIISAVKRAFGLDRCAWRGYASFQAYVQLAIVTFNLQILALHIL
jgi:IS5 family transposase